MESLVSDTGVILSSGGLKVVLLADNVPYCPEDAGTSLERMKHCDLLAFSYNGAASDYPLCYKNLSPEERRSIANVREDKREAVNRDFIDLIRRRALMPYSSEFALAGPHGKTIRRLVRRRLVGSKKEGGRELYRQYRTAYVRTLCR